MVPVEGGGGGGGGGDPDAAVVAVTRFDNGPNTAFTFNVPRKATSRKSYWVDGFIPRTRQVSVLPMVVPEIGVAQVPLEADGAEPQEIGEGANLKSYSAGWPVPSLTWVKARLTDVLSNAITRRSVTVPGAPGAPVAPMLFTVMVALPDLYPRDAVMTDVPAPTPVISPVESTVAIDVSLELQLGVRETI